MFCPNCGKELPSAALFCPNCGHSVSEELQQPQQKELSEVPIPDQNSENTSQESNSAEEIVQKKKTTLLPKNKLLRIGLIVWIGIVAFYTIFNIGGIVRKKWLESNFPYYSSSGPNKNDLYAGTVTSTLPLGNTFGQKDFSFIPIEVSYVSNKVGYDDNGEPYVIITLDIMCLFDKWEPQFDDIKFCLDGDYVSNHKYTDTEIARGESAQYSFMHTLTSSTKDVTMQLVVKCVTGATVNLYFPADGINNDNYAVNSSGSVFADYGWLEREYMRAHDAFIRMRLSLKIIDNSSWGIIWTITEDWFGDVSILGTGYAEYIGGGDTPRFYGTVDGTNENILIEYNGYNFEVTSNVNALDFGDYKVFF